jgi:hypothetical protein
MPRTPRPVDLLLLAVMLATSLVALARSERAEAATIRHVNRTDTSCGGRSPCYGSIQAAVNAAQPGDTVQIQAGAYVEQVSISGKNPAAKTEAGRIVIQADPTLPAGSVVLHGPAQQCAQGHAIRVQQSRFVTIRGLTITGAGGAGIALGGSGLNLAVRLERNRITGNGGAGCDGGITISGGNVGTSILNNVIVGNGRNGIATTDPDGGLHVVAQNTIHGNGWNGVSVSRTHALLLINNAITGNGILPGATGGRVGVRREAAAGALPAAIALRNNLICGNRLGEIAGPVLDGTDGANLTPTGGEGAGVIASAGCDGAATVYRDLRADLADLLDVDPSPAAGSPLVDRGLDPRTVLTPDLNARLEADYFAEGVRPAPGPGGGAPRFDIGAVEVRPSAGPPSIVFQEPPQNAHVRGVVAVQAQATAAGGVAAVAMRADSQPLSVSVTPDPPASPVTATASWSTTAVADGVHTLIATATGAAQQTATAGRTVIVDNAPPNTQITGGPDGAIAATSGTFTFAGTDNLTPAASLTFAWRLDGGAYTSFSASTTAALSGLGPGAHTFTVKARDLAGNEDQSPAQRTFTVSTQQVIITEPTAGATVPSGALLVRGTVVSGGAEIGVTVNGVVAAIQGSTFAAMVPVASPSAALTAVATAQSGATATHTVTVTVSDQGENAVTLRAHPGTGAAPLATSFSILGGPVPSRIELDFDGNGQVDFVGLTLDGQRFTYASPGMYVPRVRVIDAQGAVFTASAVVEVLDRAAIDTRLQARWTTLRAALSQGDVSAALALFATASREAYQDQLTALAGVGALGQIAADLGPITPVRVLDKAAEYELRAVQRGVAYSFHVLFVVDTDGVWRLRGF